jgi:tRNA-splicing ligase RtcB (3'-phosphate/5'-hydroxy nucleic acid ligase)
MKGITPKDLTHLGYVNNKARSLALQIIKKHFKHQNKREHIELLNQVLERPESFEEDPVWSLLSMTLQGKKPAKSFAHFHLSASPAPLKIYGRPEIDDATIKQMEISMSLPVSIAGALMPDAHVGFGLPIGGVLATDNAVIPYAVGVDIGCRMALSIIDESETFFKRYSHQSKEVLREWTHFGMEGGIAIKQEHSILDDMRFGSTALLRKLQIKASRQLGSSGSGNHFVEFGEIELYEGNSARLSPGKYLALLSHSGSRGLGANIAQHYIQHAMNSCKLPRHAQQLAWLDLGSEAGQEYWLGMNLAGDYAKACHERIHYNVCKALGLKILTTVENHHNFAWKEKLPDGSEAIVHRKGATPAHEGEMGIIPGSMTTAAYLVRGKGTAESLQSASHGAGRAMSRQRARENMTASALKKMLASAHVELIGGSLEENPLAYKDIERVMSFQHELVEVEGRFIPRIVRMNRE